MAACDVDDPLLQYALARGIISPQDVAAASAQADATEGTSRWGRTVAALIQLGTLTQAQVEQLYAAAVEAASPTPLEMARTLDGSSAGAAQSVPNTHSAFPIPNWEKYEFLELLGRGGMGAVYKVRDRRLGRLVALKFIHSENPGQLQRFMQEAHAQAQLDHPSICKVYEVGWVERKPYIAMQLVNGLPLDRAARSMTLLEKVQVLKAVAEAIHAAHEQGIIHRDIKPSKVNTERNRTSNDPQRFDVLATGRQVSRPQVLRFDGVSFRSTQAGASR